jgi:hypothetical protein
VLRGETHEIDRRRRKVLPDAQVTIDFDRSGLICRMLINADPSQIGSAAAGDGSHSPE